MHQFFIKQIGLGHTIMLYLITLILSVTVWNVTDMSKRINYALDYELGIAQLCNGSDESYEVYSCTYDYSDLLSKENL